MKRILIAEDNNELRELISDYLSNKGFRIITCSDGYEAIDKFYKDEYDLVILDVMMPGIDGFSVCEEIRVSSDVPIVFLTAKVSEVDQLKGYKLGASEYITKPISLPILYAKCNAILGRSSDVSKVLISGSISMDTACQKVTVNGKDINLQAKDYAILKLFMNNPNIILTRDTIINKIWGANSDAVDRSVDTHIKNLRKKLGDSGTRIRTIIKTGYVFDEKNY